MMYVDRGWGPSFIGRMSLGSGEGPVFGYPDDYYAYIIDEDGEATKVRPRKCNFCAPSLEFCFKIKKPNCDTITQAMAEYEQWLEKHAKRLRNAGAEEVVACALREPYFLPKKTNGPPAFLFADISFFGYTKRKRKKK